MLQTPGVCNLRGNNLVHTALMKDESRCGNTV